MLKKFLFPFLLAFVLVLVGGLQPALAQEKIFTLEELAKNDGIDGRPAYYGYEGKVYDVTQSTLWKLGQHFGHSAGKDLTGKLEGAPHGDDIVKAMPLVGVLQGGAPIVSPAPVKAVGPVPTESSTKPWYQAPIRVFGFSLLAWTGFFLLVFFVLNFATCFALPWSKFPLPWHGSRPGPDALDANLRMKWANIHKYFAWATVVFGIIHGVIGFLQVYGWRL